MTCMSGGGRGSSDGGRGFGAAARATVRRRPVPEMGAAARRNPVRTACGVGHAMVDGMHCPYCHHAETKVIETRVSEDGYSIRRRRMCLHCNKRFTTLETTTLLVEKRSGSLEPFNRDKVISGVRKACQGRPVKEDDLRKLGQRVEEDLRSTGQAQVTSDEVGKAILKPLKELDQVAYLRFASVYQNFENLSDFQQAIDALKEE
ncbi:NrdR family transcriptional regulator [Bifidobacterium stellenboschense]|uniref:Transcriptional repressor NrdR n=2 Tax=Bifidobacterium stellenboschense TaxID=762211 RepID=A0A087DQT2_9BIFI|nr:NrdR family transcriptional regulator [Bifidobacterium stellenboschense]